MPRNVLVAAVATLVAVILLALWANQQGLLFQDYPALLKAVHDEELLGHGFLDTTDVDAFPRLARGEKKTTEPAVIDGKTITLSREWYADGKPRVEQGWLNGKKHGPDVWWDEQGRKVRESHWQNGCLHGRLARWYRDGQLAEEASYDLFRLHGIHRTWHANGRPSMRCEYRNGLRHGEFLAWYPDGSLWCQATFKDDKLDGPWQKWGPDGKLIKQAEYRGGEIVAGTAGRGTEPFAYPGGLGSTDFAFVLAQGSGWAGFHTLRVSAAGWCEFRYFIQTQQVAGADDGRVNLPEGEVYTTPVWRKAEVQLSDEMQRGLRDAVRAADLFGLGDQYIDKRDYDGTQWVARLRAGGQEKKVFCSNKFPGPLRALSRTLRDLVMAPHKLELLTATRCGEDPKFAHEGWPEDGTK